MLPNHVVPSALSSAYSAWRAACNDADTNVEDDEAVARLLTAKRDAAWQIVRAPVESKRDWPILALAVQEIFSEADLIGTPTDRIHRVMLSKLLGEIISDSDDAAP
jgi:hypothetical protein